MKVQVQFSAPINTVTIRTPVKINEITQNELFKRIKKLSPASTGEYLSNVISEIEYYNRYF